MIKLVSFINDFMFIIIIIIIIIITIIIISSIQYVAVNSKI